MSSWWGSSSSSSSSSSYDSGSTGSSDFSSSSSSGDFGSDFSTQSYTPSLSSSDPQAALRLALQQEQQKAVVQAAIAKLTELCWETCVQKPDAKLSSSEQSCISNCAERYLDASMFVMGRLTKGAR